MSGLNVILLLSCWITAGIATEAPSKPVLHYRVKNTKLCLQVGKSPPYEDVAWHFNSTAVTLLKKVTPRYKGRVDFNETDGSLCINNLTEKDSGIYEASITDKDFAVSKEQHKLIIQETVPTPVIRISVIHSNVSAGFCNVTVNCSIQDDSVWSVCDKNSCSTYRRSRREVNAIDITVSAQNGSIVCSGNNNVSTSNVSKMIGRMCFLKSRPEQEEKPQMFFKKVMTIVSVILVIASFSLLYVLSRKCHHHQAQTPSAQIIQSQPDEVPVQSVPRASVSSSSEVEASYENVDATQLNLTYSPTMSPAEESEKVDTVYSFVTGPDLAASVGKSDGREDAKGHVKVSTAWPVAVDTVYSVLQKPQNMKL